MKTKTPPAYLKRKPMMHFNHLFEALIEEHFQMTGPNDASYITQQTTELCTTREVAVLWILHTMRIQHPTLLSKIPPHWRGGPLELGQVHVVVAKREIRNR